MESSDNWIVNEGISVGFWTSNTLNLCRDISMKISLRRMSVSKKISTLWVRPYVAGRDERYAHAVHKEEQHLFLKIVAQFGEEAENQYRQILTLRNRHRLQNGEVGHSVLPVNTNVVELLQKNLERLGGDGQEQKRHQTNRHSTS